MNRTVFATAVPIIATATGALVFADIVASGFQSEGCRFAFEGARWRAGGEWLLVQAVFAVPFLLLLGLLVSTIRKRETSPRRPSGLAKWCIVFGLTTIIAWTLQGLFFVLTCGSTAGIGATLAMLLPVMRALTSVSFLAFLACVAGAYVRGLQPDREIIKNIKE